MRISPGMGNDKGNESVKNEMEDGEAEPMTDDENVTTAEKTAGVKVKIEGVDDGERVGVGESGKERRNEDSKEREGDNRAEQEVVEGSNGGPWNVSEKKESREAEEDTEHENGGHGSEEEEGGKEAETGQRLDAQEVQNSDEGEDDDEETPERNEEEEEKSVEEEQERKEAEKDLALTMSSSWAPMGDRGERDGGGRSFMKGGSKSGKEEMAEREFGAFRQVQSEGGFKERIRLREGDSEHSKEKSRLKKQRLEPPLLSLSLPDTSLHLASPDGHARSSHGHAVKSKGLVPSSSENERSFRSLAPTQSQSNGYTNSLSLSLSHPFFHNASCSLTQNSFDDKEGTTCSSGQVNLKNERLEGTQGSHASCQVSYGREQYFHGNHTAEGSHDRSRHRRELPMYQRILQNGSAQFQTAEGTRDSSHSFMDERGSLVGGNEGSHGGHLPTDHYRWREEASLTTEMERSRTGHDRHWGNHKDKNARLHPEGWPSPTKTSSLQERLRMAERERRDADPGRELSLSGSRGFHERDDESTDPERSAGGVEENPQGIESMARFWLHEIVADPVVTMSHKLHRVPERFLEGLRKCTQDMLTSKKKRDDFVTLQRLLSRRTDLTTDTLHQSHRTQLEILVALKTGIPAFLYPDTVPLTTGELTEIFLGTKCRNVACKSQLPADDCECKICTVKSGFCNACMCVVCCKFDFVSNTCRWIGCDYCLHWCHSDCGNQMGFIASGISPQGTSDNVVRLFRCIGCGQASELYGFVKDVFVSCCKDWKPEVLELELECVRKIFHRSEDLPGKQLFMRAEQLLVKLRSSKDPQAVCASMIKFFNGRDLAASKSTARATTQGAEAVTQPPRELNSKLADAVRDAMNVMNAPSTDRSDLENARQALQYLDNEVEEKRRKASEIQYDRFCQKHGVEELESIVSIKENEALVFQQKADECRREAEALSGIVQLKNEKIEEEYQGKLDKLRLTELEEKRRKWYEEVQAMEKSQRDFSAMKMSMVSDIRELLKKMEAGKAQIT